MNKVNLVGRLTRDPEVKNTTTGKAVATFTLAVDRRFKNKDGQKEADFVPIVVWGKQAEFVGQYLSKGSQIGVSGRLQVRSYDGQDGQRRYVTEVVADEVYFISTKRKENNGSNPNGLSPEMGNGVMGLDEDFHLMADEDDIPF
ncbi:MULTISPECIES: single-stranded DNA-binding protein [unclassified Acetobacterium]|jgi:single-strand DNA-binding protein|uniref:single-stranded DNA-binding protein n=1 Tax=unclassified Acetobacterium TaxID=2638182 RepID=UPI000DBEBA31|nr:MULTISPECIES: single-stranded DNA-binding protein [unclassified Acetobacterium]AWW28372.1 single-stranded DNA-binding protein [Acetobacterium sp. KB-1]MDZ5726681.1 single-stranded DNA-binding protein [Acetobacterium sp. K1/6]